MKEGERPKMPLCLRRSKAADELVTAINAIAARFEIPFYMMDDILFRISSEVSAGALKELNGAVASYNALVAECEMNEAREENKDREVDTNA